MRTRKCFMTLAIAASCSCLSPALAQMPPEETVKKLEVIDGLEATLWAAEPMLVNPTNIDIDSRGRVWACEGANYRSTITRPEGDRILILEDTDHDGKADSQKVFVQDVKLKSPLGVCVMGNKVYVSLSPNILVYTMDETADKPVGPPAVWMTGFEGAEHDHGVHAMVFGPDGRFYFNAGNAGTSVKEPFKWGNGKPVVDTTGSDVPRGRMWRGHERKKGEMGYMEGMAFRCNPDGGGFETLGYNFRNCYELAVDSFGTVWQSDNDDDGNEGVRINYVMEGGDFGYHGPQGHDWVRDAEAYPGQSRQQAHWHQKWPGVVPNMLHTGGGSPTGIVVYEGSLLPEKLRGALIHCDPGPNVVRAYIPKPSEQVPVKKFNEPDSLQGPDREGAGFKAEVINLIQGKDTWFRPSDVCVAPDGSLFIADWYDPGVGGHQTADIPKDARQDWHNLRGRIYRVAPKGDKPTVPKIDLSTAGGQIAALKSPNLATHYLAFAALESNLAANEMLANMAKSDPNPRFRARALWLLSHHQGSLPLLEQAMEDADVNVRVTAIRAARVLGIDLSRTALEKLRPGVSPAILRELALAMNYVPAEKATPILVQLANQFDGEDRWYLEALGIGANGKEQQLLAAWEKDGTNTRTKAGDLIRWRLRRDPPAQVRLNDHTTVVQEWWAAAPFDGAVGDPLGTNFGPDASPAAISADASFKGLDGKDVKWRRLQATPFESSIAGLKSVDFQKWCDANASRSTGVVGYFATTLSSPIDQSATLLIGADDFCKVWLNGKDVHNTVPHRTVRFAEDTAPVQLHAGANVLLIKLYQRGGTSGLLVAVEGKQKKIEATCETIPGNASPAIASSANDSSKGPVSKEGKPLPAIEELAKITGDAAAGEKVFASESGAKCISCHQIGAQGRMLGPPLTTVGQKLSKAQLYEAILKPNAGILMGYENWAVKTKKGQVFSGLKTSDTADGVTIKDTDGKYHDIAAGDIARQVKQNVSIMPENLSQGMTQKELVDLVEYLSTLRSRS